MKGPTIHGISVFGIAKDLVLMSATVTAVALTTVGNHLLETKPVPVPFSSKA